MSNSGHTYITGEICPVRTSNKTSAMEIGYKLHITASATEHAQ